MDENCGRKHIFGWMKAYFMDTDQSHCNQEYFFLLGNEEVRPMRSLVPIFLDLCGIASDFDSTKEFVAGSDDG
jgi:hypothetical protein